MIHFVVARSGLCGLSDFHSIQTSVQKPEKLRFLFQVAEPNLTCKMTGLCWGERGRREFGSLSYDIYSSPSATELKDVFCAPLSPLMCH